MTLRRLLQLTRRTRPDPGQAVAVIGLGNPGPEYEDTRHNVGFRVVNEVARRLDATFQPSGPSLVAACRLAGRRLVLCKPQTFMNRSGEAVLSLVRGTRPGLLLVVYDDLDLPPGRLRLRPGGGAGGHRGMESVLLFLDREDVPRLRIGIGRPDGEADVVDWVLSVPSDEDGAALAGAVSSAADAVAVVVTRGIAAAMEKYN